MAPRSKSVVDNIVARLSESERQKISEEMKRIAEEKLRILQTRMGKYSKGDSPEGRAAALLDVLVRAAGDGSSNNKAPVKDLNKACGMSQKVFNSLLLKVGHHVDALSSTKNHPQKRNAAQSRMKLTMPSNKRGRHQQATIIDPRVKAPDNTNSIISILSIRFVSLLTDSLGFAKRAQHLYEELQHHIERTITNRHEKTRYLADIARNPEIYQVACFYYLLIQESSVIKDETVKETIIEAAKVRSAKEFEEYSKIVKKFAEELEEIKREKKRPVPNTSVGNENKKRKTRTSEKAERDKAALELLQTTEEALKRGDGNVEGGHHAANVIMEKYTYSVSFKRWRTRVLEDATNEVTQDNVLVYDEAIRKAADAVLEKFDIKV